MLKLNERDFAWNIIEEKFYLYYVVKGIYYEMNKTAKMIWELLHENPNMNRKEIANRMLLLYDGCTYEQVQRDVDNFIECLIEINALQIIEAESTGEATNEETKE